MFADRAKIIQERAEMDMSASAVKNMSLTAGRTEAMAAREGILFFWRTMGLIH